MHVLFLNKCITHEYVLMCAFVLLFINLAQTIEQTITIKNPLNHGKRILLVKTTMNYIV